MLSKHNQTIILYTFYSKIIQNYQFKTGSGKACRTKYTIIGWYIVLLQWKTLIF